MFHRGRQATHGGLWLGYAVERLFMPLMRKQLPEVVDMHMPAEVSSIT